MILGALRAGAGHGGTRLGSTLLGQQIVTLLQSVKPCSISALAKFNVFFKLCRGRRSFFKGCPGNHYHQKLALGSRKAGHACSGPGDRKLKKVRRDLPNDYR